MQPQPATGLTPAEASFARDTAVKHLSAEHPVTLRVVDAIPLDQGDFRPDAIAKSAADLAWHMGAKVPAIYGESYDSAQAGKAPA
jgi:hypothetical protein